MKNSNKNCFQFIDTFKITIYQRKVSSMYKIYQGNYSVEKGFIYFYLNSKFLHSVPLISTIDHSQFCYLINSIILFKLQIYKYLNFQAVNMVCFQ